MAKNFGARKNNKYKVISTSPSVNKTPRGPAIVNVPYDVQQDLSKAEGTSPNVFFNGDPAYVKTSHSTKVTGDKEGSHGGVKSGTVEAQSDPIEASSSVFINGKAVVRVGDKQYMQGKNTIGKVNGQSAASPATITDDGKIVGLETPPPIPKPYAKNKPTNNPTTSGALGSRTGSPVLVGSGKLLYTQTDFSLIAPLKIIFKRLYVSDGRMGMFGMGWSSVYEQRLISSDPSTLTLSYPDDRSFAFTFIDDVFDDSDALGATLTSLGSEKFELYYYADAHREVYENGYLVTVMDRNGNRVTLVRDGNGRLERIESGSSFITLDYNSHGLVGQLSDHTGRVWKYTYEDVFTDTKQPHTYQHSHLISVTDALGGVKRFEYLNNQLVRCSEETSREALSVTYDTVGKVASYCERGETFGYTYQSNRTIKTSDTGDKTFYAVDDFGCISAITYPDGTTTKEIFENNVSTVRDRGDNIHISEYDDKGRLIRYVYPQMDKREIVYTYEEDNPFYVTKEENFGKVTVCTYDKHFNRTSKTTPDGSVESFEYDERGNKVTHTHKDGTVTLYAYNDNHQRIRSTDALGGISQYVYDEFGNNTAIIDPLENITTYEYNAIGMMTSIRNGSQLVAMFTQDGASRMTTITDGVSNVTRYGYDVFGYLESETLPNGLNRTFTHQRGKLVSSVSESGVVCTYEYSKSGHCIAKHIGNSITHYTYDTLGNLLSAKEGDNLIQYVYDTNANIRLEHQRDKTVSYAYEHNGDKRFIGYEGMHFSLLRNKNGHIERIAQGGNTYTFGFNDTGTQTTITYPNAIESKSMFDPLGRLTNRFLGDTPLLNYMYDKSSRIVMRNDTVYDYSQSGELLGDGGVVYTYDSLGNRIDSNAPQCTYNTLGQLTQKQTNEFITTYAYDMQGRLVGYSKTSTSPVRTELVEVQLRFTYDPLGRRLTKYYKDEVQKYHHRYLYAGDNIVAIYDNDTDTLLATLLHEEDGTDSPLSIHVHPQELMTQEEREVFENMDESAQFLFTQSRIKRYYYHKDHQNSIIALSDENAQIVEYYEYDAYGNIIKSETMKDDKDNTLQTLNPYRFTGREFDTDDLYYYRARYYDPTLGRFITPDPIGFMGGDMNLHRYVGNDPVNFVDWSGFVGTSPHGTQNPSQKALTKRVPKTAVKTPTASQGGGSASSTGNGCKVSGKKIKLEPKKYLYFVFYTSTGSKNDNIFKKTALKRAKSIKNGTNYRENIDIVYLEKASKTSEIVKYVHQKVAENGGKEKTFIKIIEVFAELTADHNGNINIIKSKKSIINNKTQMKPYDDQLRPIPYITVPMDKATINTINNSILAKERNNQTIAENEARFFKEFKAGTITGLKQVDTTLSALAIATGTKNKKATILLSILSLAAKGILYKLEDTSPVRFSSGLTFDTTVDAFTDGDKKLQIAGELIVKPYFSWIADEITKTKKSRN